MSDDGRSQGTLPGIQGTNRAVRWILSVTGALFFLQVTVFAPADMQSSIGFVSPDLAHRWWTVVTFPFVHTAGWPLVVNLLVLGTFGSVLERRWGTGEFLRYYFTCALGAWIAHLAFVSSDAVLAGSAAPAMGALLAYTAVAGEERHFRVGALSLTTGWLVLIGSLAVLATGISAAEPGSATAYLAHVGGVVAGWMYLRTAASVSFSRIRDGVSPAVDEPDDMLPRAIPRAHRTQRAEDDIVAQSHAALARASAAQPSVAAAERGDENTLDRLLDKISAHGIDSLTADERTLLDDVSRRLRDH